MTVKELISKLDNPENYSLKVSFLVANARSDYHVNARLENIDIDEEDGHISFLLKKVV